METIEELSKKIKEYEKRMGIGKFDPAKEGYMVLVKILQQQNKYLDSIEIKNMIVVEDKTKAASEYERAKALWEKLPNMIQSVSDLRVALKMDGEERRAAYSPINAKSIANGED